MKKHVLENKAQEAPWILKFGGYEFFDCSHTKERRAKGVQEVIEWMLRANDIPAVERFVDMCGGMGYVVLPYRGSESVAVHQRVSGHFHIIKDDKNDLYFTPSIKCNNFVLQESKKLGYPRYNEFEGKIVSFLYTNSYKTEQDVWSDVFLAAKKFVFDGYFEFRYKLPATDGLEQLKQIKRDWQHLYPSHYK